jgi:hypothetical protein
MLQTVLKLVGETFLFSDCRKASRCLSALAFFSRLTDVTRRIASQRFPHNMVNVLAKTVVAQVTNLVMSVCRPLVNHLRSFEVDWRMNASQRQTIQLPEDAQ